MSRRTRVPRSPLTSRRRAPNWVQIATFNLLAPPKVSVWFLVSASWWGTDVHTCFNLLVYLFMRCLWFWVSEPFEVTGFYATPPSTNNRVLQLSVIYLYVLPKECDSEWVDHLKVPAFSQLKSRTSTYSDLQRLLYDSERVLRGEIHTCFCLLVWICM